MFDENFFSNADFENYKTLLYRESGINFTEANKPILVQRLKSCLTDKNIESADEYYQILIKNREELKHFIDAVTTNLTWFFRNETQFLALDRYALPEILKVKKQTGDNIIRVWSAGCSTGEEPYSLAVLLAERLPAGFKYQIVAGDLSLKCLMTAKEGVYEKSKVLNDHIKNIFSLPEIVISKYFEETEKGYKAKDDFKANIRFDYHNLKHSSMWKNFDIVFCRNVLIYFDEATQIEVVNHFWDAMSSHSFIFIGHSETLLGLKTKFEFVKTNWATLYKKWPRQTGEV